MGNKGRDAKDLSSGSFHSRRAESKTNKCSIRSYGIPSWRALATLECFLVEMVFDLAFEGQGGIGTERAFQGFYWLFIRLIEVIWASSVTSPWPPNSQHLSVAMEELFSQPEKFWFWYMQITHVGDKKERDWGKEEEKEVNWAWSNCRGFYSMTWAKKFKRTMVELLFLQVWRSRDVALDPTEARRVSL